MREINLTPLASCVVSTSKGGHGAEYLVDDDLKTYWESALPTDRVRGKMENDIELQFLKPVAIKEMIFFVDSTLDQSYTPTVILIRAGTNSDDVIEVREIELENEPSGWISVPLSEDGFIYPEGGTRPLHRASYIQICIIANLRAGRDTRLRQLKLLGERVPTSLTKLQLLPEFSTIGFSQFSCIR